MVDAEGKCKNCPNILDIMTTITRIDTNVEHMMAHIKDYDERNEKQHTEFYERTDDNAETLTKVNTKVNIYTGVVGAVFGIFGAGLAWIFSWIFNHASRSL